MSDTPVHGWSGRALPLSPDEITEFQSRFVDYEYFGGDADVPWPSDRERPAQ